MDKVSVWYGGENVVIVLRVYGVWFIFMLVGGYIFLLLVVCEKLGICVVDICYEVMVVFVVDVVVCLFGMVGVVVVIVGFGFINMVMVVKNV